jgi:hypothetical protein
MLIVHVSTVQEATIFIAIELLSRSSAWHQRTGAMGRTKPHRGSNFDEFLQEEGMLEEV